MLYERLKGRRDLTRIEELLCILVHAQKAKLKFAEVQIIALAGKTDENGQQLEAAVDHYQSLMFPGHEQPKDSWEDEAKKLLAEEVKKVYLVKPKEGIGRIADIRKATTASNPHVREWATEQIQKDSNAQARLRGPKS